MMKLFQSVLLFLSLSFASAQVKNSKPFILGHTDEIPSQILHEKRILNIYLPDEYNEKDTARYSVIYLFDGSRNEDFIHVAGIVQFNNFPWLNKQKCIVVGIANVNRQRDFTYPTTIVEAKKELPNTGESAKFISFLENEVQPYIDKNFKVNQDKAIIGESLGGLLAAEILLKKPGLFNSYIIISPSLWWDDGSLLKFNTERLRADTRVKNVYIAVGKEGLTPGNPPHVMEVDVNLFLEKIKKLNKKNMKVYFEYFPNEDHATISHQAIYNALRMLF